MEVLPISYLCTPFVYLNEIKILQWLKFLPDYRMGKEGDLDFSLNVMDVLCFVQVP